ncbi:MAG: hypothetical protein IJ193_04590 [Bacilli bacterium]|nr:hypothetical protein [Bacilli bacterium]
MRKFTRKEFKVISAAVACYGLMFIGTGIAMNNHETTVVQTSYSLGVYQNKVAESKTNEIKLKEMTLEVNMPLSVDVKDYLEDYETLDESVIKALKLDTSNVNIKEKGTYTYTISYKRKKYNGTFKVIEKELPIVNITLRNLTLKKDTVLDTNLSTYIKEQLSDEVAKNIVLDLSAVKTNVEGTYQYTVTYANRIYTANIEIFTPQAPTVITPNTETQTTNTETNTTTQP